MTLNYSQPLCFVQRLPFRDFTPSTTPQAIEESFRQQSGLEAKVTNVVATKVARRRQILSDTVEITYTLVLPAAPGAEQSTFEAAVADLSAAASGGAIATGLASLGIVATDAFVAPATFEPVDSAATW